MGSQRVGHNWAIELNWNQRWLGVLHPQQVREIYLQRCGSKPRKLSDWLQFKQLPYLGKHSWLWLIVLKYHFLRLEDISFFFFFFNFYFLKFYFLTLQYCIGFAIYRNESATGLHVFPGHPEPSSLLPPHTIPLGHPSAPAPSIQYPSSNLDWRLI